MERQEKRAKIYFVLLALTAAFLCALASRAHEKRQLRQESSYTVQTQYAPAE